MNKGLRMMFGMMKRRSATQRQASRWWKTLRIVFWHKTIRLKRFPTENNINIALSDFNLFEYVLLLTNSKNSNEESHKSGAPDAKVLVEKSDMHIN